MAKFTVRASVGTKKVEFEANVETFGQLKQAFEEHGVSYNPDMQAIVQSTKSALLTDDSIVPAGDQTIFLMPKKTKSGWTPEGWDGDDIEDASTDELIERKEQLAVETAAVQAELDRRAFRVLATTDVDKQEEEPLPAWLQEI